MVMMRHMPPHECAAGAEAGNTADPECSMDAERNGDDGDGVLNARDIAHGTDCSAVLQARQALSPRRAEVP